VGGADPARDRKGGSHGAWLCFQDEAGASLTGAVARTWAPAGQTPTLTVVKGRQPKLSMAALLCFRPGEPPRLIHRTLPGRWRDRDLVALLDQAHQALDAPMVLVWDNLAGHHSRRMQHAIRHRPWLTVHYLPAYAPDPNPVEQVWAHLERTALADLAALTLDELTHAVRTGLRRIQHRPALLDAFLAHTGLAIHPAPT
jgi:transposase